MDRKNHDYLQDDLVEYVEVTDEEILETEEGLEEASTHNPETAPHDSVKSVSAAGATGKKQPLRKGDKQNSEAMVKAAGAKAKEAIMAKENFDFAEDLDALVESEATLSESFREKAEVIFEAALSSKLTEHVERLEEEYQTQLDEQVQQIQESLVEKIDGYLNYVVESWVEENKLAIGNGLRTEIAESFMSALHGVFTEHYIQVPDEKVDLVDGLAEKIEELEEQLNKSVQYNIDLTEAVNEFARESVIRESAKDLSAAQGERLRSLVEDIAFDSEDAFAQKVETVKNSYFRKVSVQTQSEDEQLDEGTAKQLEVSPIMQTYLAALKK